MSIARMKVGGREVQSAMLGGAVLYSAARYEELEYIEFDNVATIDLALDHVTGYEYETIFNILAVAGRWSTIFRNSNGPNTSYTIVGLYSNTPSTQFLPGYEIAYGDLSGKGTITLGETYDVCLRASEMVINGESIAIQEPTDIPKFYSKALFLGQLTAQHFLFRVKDAEGNVVCDCRPARRISDGECGMYDRARGIFLPRTSERGEVTGDYPTGRLYF